MLNNWLTAGQQICKDLKLKLKIGFLMQKTARFVKVKAKEINAKHLFFSNFSSIIWLESKSIKFIISNKEGIWNLSTYRKAD